MGAALQLYTAQNLCGAALWPYAGPLRLHTGTPYLGLRKGSYHILEDLEGRYQRMLWRTGFPDVTGWDPVPSLAHTRSPNTMYTGFREGRP